MGGDRGDAQGPDGIPPSSSATYHRDDGETWGLRRVGVSRGIGGDGLCGAPPVRLYIKRRQTAIAEKVVCWPVYALCTEAERMPGTRWIVHWWDQDTVNKPEV